MASLWSRCLLAVAGPLVLFGGAEVALRVTGRRPVFVPDRQFLYRLDTQGAFQRRGAHINSRGYRGAEIATPRPAGRLRILALGGSTTFGHELADHETWPHHLQLQLGERGIDAEVINGGVPGWGTEHCFERLQRDGEWLAPDLVILYSGLNWPAIDEWRSFNPFPYHFSLVRSIPLPLLQSRVFLSLCKKANRLHGRRSRDAVALARGFEPDHRDDLLAGQLRRFAAWSRDHDIPVALVLYPALVGEKARPEEVAVYGDTLRRDWSSPAQPSDQIFREMRRVCRQNHAVLRARAAQEGLPLLDVARSFATLDPAVREPLFLDRIHLTDAGNQQIARGLVEQLERAHLLP